MAQTEKTKTDAAKVEEVKTDAKDAKGAKDAKDAKKAVDYVAQIGGNLNLANAGEFFGEGSAVAAIQAAARAGGYGELSEDEITANAFGGLQMPHSAETRRTINAALNDLQ